LPVKKEKKQTIGVQNQGIQKKINTFAVPF